MRGKEQKLRYYFKNGALYVDEKRALVHVRGWPDPVSHRRIHHNKWKPHAPEFRLVSPSLRPRKGRNRAPKNQLTLGIECEVRVPDVRLKWTKDDAYRSFRMTLPDELGDAIESFVCHQWLVIVMAHVGGQAAIDLLNSSPFLAFTLANERVFAGLLQLPEEHGRVRGTLSRKQRGILRCLKLPDTKSTMKILQKVHPGSASPETVKTLRVVVNDAAACENLKHLPALNTGVLTLLAEPRVRRLCTPALLGEVSRTSQENYYPHTARMLKRTLRLFNRFRRGQQLTPFRSFQAINELHEELAVQDQAARGLDIDPETRFPDPPVPGTKSISPIRSYRELIEEGREQHNCVAGYAESVLGGRSCIYRITWPERATLELVPTPGHAWRLSELKGTCNRSVSPKTVQHVKKWLNAHTVGVDT